MILYKIRRDWDFPSAKHGALPNFEFLASSLSFGAAFLSGKKRCSQISRRKQTNLDFSFASVSLLKEKGFSRPAQYQVVPSRHEKTMNFHVFKIFYSMVLKLHLKHFFDFLNGVCIFRILVKSYEINCPRKSQGKSIFLFGFSRSMQRTSSYFIRFNS